MKPYLYIFVSFGYLGFACNAERQIRVENRTGSHAALTWVINQDSLHQCPLFISNSDTVSWVLPGVPPHNKLKLSLGAGSWSAATLKDFVNDLHSLEIQWRTHTIKLDTTGILDFLHPRKRRIDKSQIAIVLK